MNKKTLTSDGIFAIVAIFVAVLAFGYTFTLEKFPTDISVGVLEEAIFGVKGLGVQVEGATKDLEQLKKLQEES